MGYLNHPFYIPKFRTMYVHTPTIATNLLKKPSSYLTFMGPFLRKTSLDELPQLWSILKGDMTFVGPRPVLLSEKNLIDLRTKNSVHTLIPGLTGWAQINGRDTLPDLEKVKLDVEYLHRKSLLFDLWIILLTTWQVFRRQHVSH